MNKWAWCHEYEADARARGDADRLRMARLHYEGWGWRETDPDRPTPSMTRAGSWRGGWASRGGSCSTPTGGSGRCSTSSATTAT